MSILALLQSATYQTMLYEDMCTGFRRAFPTAVGLEASILEDRTANTAMLRNCFVMAPDRYLVPAFKMSPFRTSDLALNRNLPFSADIDDYFSDRFKNRRFVYCANGRQAIGLALKHLGVGANSHVTILTTTGNSYISGCVTAEIEKLGRWSRELREDTNAVFVNHEFGFAFEQLLDLKRRNVPIIEDACYAFASDNGEHSLSRVGSFTVYSFPKFFPIQVGGLLVFEDRFDVEEPVDAETKRYMQKVLSFHIQRLDVIKQARREHYRYLAARFQALGFPPRFELTDSTVPGAFMFKTGGTVDLPALKTFLCNQGLECSVFYGEDAFFIPVNQALAKGELDYFYESVSCFVKQGKSKVSEPVT